MNERAPSDEHVFPLALGGTLHCYRVCEPCNSRLGREVDIRLIDHIVCQIKRAELQLPGNSGSVPDPLIRMAATSVLKEDPAKQIELRSDGKGGYDAKHRYHMVERTDEDGTVIKTITIDAGQPQQVPKIIDRKRKRAGARPLIAEERKEIDSKLPIAV